MRRGTRRQVQAVFREWGIEVHPERDHSASSLVLDLGETRETLRKIRQNLGNLQRELLPLGWRVTVWRYEYLPPTVSLTEVGAVPPSKRRAKYYHYTPRAQVASILSQGLLPRRNYEYVLNPRPAVFLAASLFSASESAPCGRGEREVLEIRVPPEVSLYPDPEMAWHGETRYSVVYSLRRIPPEALRMLPEEERLNLCALERSQYMSRTT